MTISDINSYFISQWLSGGKFYLKSPLYMACEDHVWKRLFVGFDAAVPLHEACEFPLIPFDQAQSRCFSYLDEACAMLSRNMPRWSPTPTESAIIIEKLGSPPLNSYSIYIISVSHSLDDEEIVYVGKTNSSTHRFRGGHAAISKLHAPKYDGMKKTVYFGCVVGVNDDDNYIPIEWINKDCGRDQILDDVESQMIFHLKPELNTRGKENCLALKRIPLYIQNLHSPALEIDSFDTEYDVSEE